MLKRTFGVLLGVLLCLAGFHLYQYASVHAQAGEAALHKEASFDLLISQPYERVGPLFGADGERAWGGADWDPQFVFPSPAQDIPGAVFTVHHGVHKTLWVTPIFDLEHHHIQHLILIPDAMVTQIDITFPECLPNSTRVHVVYRRTALSPTLNEHVEKVSAHDALVSKEWQKEIDAYFAGQQRRNKQTGR